MQSNIENLLIGIDGNEANIKNRVGVGKYAYEVLWQLYKNQKSKIKNQKYNLKFKIYLKDKPRNDLPLEDDWWQYQVVGPRKLWTQIGLPLALLKDCRLKGRQINVFFTPTHYAPRFCPCPRVISIMDLSFLHFPEMFRKKDLYQLKNWTAYSIKKAAKILTISQASKSDIIKYYQVPEEKVVVTYPGTTMQKLKSKNQKDPVKFALQTHGASIENIKKKYNIEGDYILSVGTLQPRKNYTKLIEAFGKILKQVQNDSLGLVIVGKKGWMWEEILEAPKKFGVADKVKFLDYISDEDLLALYNGAKCFVLISLYEGFGLPVLEAMKQGCPVVVSNISSLPEVVGEAGILVDPNDVEDITKGILRVLNFNTSEYEKYVKMGRQQASKFSWEKCAKETLEVLKEVANRS